MSRCFPFPPPGYEKKPTTDEPDLLKKEKRKEKKHKKDKKDKEKKDRSEKHKEKKEKKEKKHRDKKKDKDKSKTTTPDENRIPSQFEGYNGEKLVNNIEQIKEKIIPNLNGDIVKNRIKVSDPENFKFVQELDRRIRDEEKGTGSQQFAVENRKINNFNKIEIQGRQAVADVVVPNRINGATPPPLPLPAGGNKIDKRSERKQEKGSDDKRGDKRKNKDREHKKDKNMEKEKKEKKDKKEKSERDKSKHVKKSEFVGNFNDLSPNMLENGLQGNLKKRKDMETNGVSLSHENELRPNKMARPTPNISPENGRNLVSVQNPSSSLLDKQGPSLNSFKVASKGGQSQSQNQRVNGMSPSQPVSIPAKKPPISPFNHLQSKPAPIKSPSPPVITARSPPVPTNKPPQPNHHHQPHAPKPPPAVHNPVTAHHLPPPLSSPSPPPKQPPVSRPKPPPAVVKAAVVAAPPPPPPRKPHPDTKYLNQILTVPKLDPWCGLDDQEWLFNNRTGRPVSNKTELQDPVQVWSEAKHIESLDVCALPYVIPY